MLNPVKNVDRQSELFPESEIYRFVFNHSRRARTHVHTHARARARTKHASKLVFLFRGREIKRIIIAACVNSYVAAAI